MELSVVTIRFWLGAGPVSGASTKGMVILTCPPSIKRFMIAGCFSAPHMEARLRRIKFLCPFISFVICAVAFALNQLNQAGLLVV